MIKDFKEKVEKYLNGNHPYEFGSFYTAILANDFVGIMGTADHNNKMLLLEYAQFLYHEMPGRTGNAEVDVWGSYEAVENTISRQRAKHE